MDDWWEFPATVLRVVDGDTVQVRLDLGLRIFRTETVRLDGIDAPEANTTAGTLARAYLRDLLPVGQEVRVFTRKPDKYGRTLGRVVDPLAGDVSQAMIRAGHAESYNGGKRG